MGKAFQYVLSILNVTEFLGTYKCFLRLQTKCHDGDVSLRNPTRTTKCGYQLGEEIGYQNAYRSGSLQTISIMGLTLRTR